MKKALQITGISAILAVIVVMVVVGATTDFTPKMEMGRTALADLDFQSQMDKVDYAIIGVVKEIVDVYPDKNAHEGTERYFGDILITVEEDLLGTMTDDEITIRTHANSMQAPIFEKGERALLFLIPGDPKSVEGEGVFVVSGMYQGKYTITEGIAQDPRNPKLTHNLADLKYQITSLRD